MRLRIINETDYDTQALRKIIKRAAIETFPKPRRDLGVMVRKSRKRVCGRAGLGGAFWYVPEIHHIRVWLPPTPFDHARLAWVVAHECLHVMGLNHSDMNDAGKKWWYPRNLEPFAWARAVPIPKKETPMKTAASPKKPRKKKTAKKKATAKNDKRVVFAIRLPKADRDLIHAAAGPRGASRFVHDAALAAASGDRKAFNRLAERAKANRS